MEAAREVPGRFRLYLRCISRMESELHVGNLLRIGRRAEDFALVLLERLDPVGDVAGVLSRLRRETWRVQWDAFRSFARGCALRLPEMAFKGSRSVRCPADSFRRPNVFRINKSFGLVVVSAPPSELRGEMICEL